MLDYHFRTVTLGGNLIAEATSQARDISEAISCGLRIARDTKERQPPGSCADTWLVDIIDPFGRWVIGLPLSMVSRSRFEDEPAPAQTSVAA